MLLLQKMLHKRIFLIIITIGISVLSIAVTLWWNTQLSEIINTVSIGQSVTRPTVILAVISMLASGVVAYGLGLISGWTCETLAHDLRMGYARNISNMTITEVENLNAGEQLSKLQNEISDVSEYLRSNLFQIVDNGIRFIATFSWLLFLNPTLTLSANLPVVIIMVYVVYSSKVIGIAAKQSQQAKMQMNGYADTLLTLFPVIRIYNASTLIFRRYNTELKKWEQLSIKEERTRAKLMSFSALLSCIPLLLLFLVGGTMVVNDQITLGTLYIFINLSGNVSGVMMNLPGYIAAFRRFSANMKRLEPCVLLDNRRR
jgi:ABC-type multidrug transport system fused ATPase/permease subunit